MELTRLLVTATALLLLLFSRAEAGEVGVNYGTVANDLPNPASVVQLMKENGITMAKIYDTNATVLTSLGNTDIKTMVTMPNQYLARAARDPSYAAQWVQDNVKRYYPSTRIHSVAVGNEVFDDPSVDKMSLVPAMANVQRALAQQGLASAVKVSSPIAFSAVQDSYPPSRASFRPDLALPVMKPMLDLLRRTGSFLTVNIYPCLTQMQQPDTISMDYVLGNAQHAVVDGSNQYHSLLDAELDATHYAMEKLGFADVEAVLGETGCPSKGTIGKHKPPAARRLLDGSPPVEATVATAQAYNNYVINRVLAGNTGTPHRPGADMHVYIFALFNENDKSADPDDVERNFGLFYPNMTKVYEFDFRGGGQAPAPPAPSWCVANAGVGDDRLQEALDYACGHGADCSAIQPGGSCFQPDTMAAHASYAFDSYYQRNGRAISACGFNGAASIVYQAPADTCGIAKASWCVANAAVGDERLKTAMDYACGHGADCSAIQPGGSCFQPDTMAAHASYAFDSYYQRNDRARVACDFSGAGSIVYQQPSLCAATASWCVANAAVGDARLKTAMDYACGHGADCSAIQPGGACFQPDTMASHASYAFNSYYQHNDRARVACDFSGAGSVVYQQPKVGNCVL